MIKPLSGMGNYSFTDKYTADEDGNVYHNKPSKYHPTIKIGDPVSSFINKYGYVEYILVDKNGKKKHIQAHRIVASLFIPNKDNKKYVNHIDGNKQNNNIANLEWTTASENEQHSYHVLKKQTWNKSKSLPSGKEYRGTIRPVASYTKEGTLVKRYFNPTEAETDGYCRKQISAVCNNKQKTHKGLIWKYIESSQEPMAE